MNEQQREIFSRLLDLNYQVSILQSDLDQKKLSLAQLNQEFREAMGEEEYRKFMTNGKKMFAPKED
jgi:hypothetical protein